jgi:hypothetical protein
MIQLFSEKKPTLAMLRVDAESLVENAILANAIAQFIISADKDDLYYFEIDIIVYLANLLSYADEVRTARGDIPLSEAYDKLQSKRIH